MIAFVKQIIGLSSLCTRVYGPEAISRQTFIISRPGRHAGPVVTNDNVKLKTQAGNNCRHAHHLFLTKRIDGVHARCVFTSCFA